MNSMHQNSHGDERIDEPPFSRIFVVCSKQFRADDLRNPFSRFGVIEDLYMPRDRNTGDSKGIAYIKFTKTSAAAAAIEEMHMKYIGTEHKPVKVMLACSNKNSYENNIENKYKRLFIKIPKDSTESDIRKAFSDHGSVKSVMIQKDKTTNENRGFAYVNFNSFLETAKAFEECDKKFKPVFATPRETLKRSCYDLDTFQGGSHMIAPRDNYFQDYDKDMTHRRLPNQLNTLPQGFTAVDVACSPIVPQKHIETLFNIVPGMKECQYTVDTYNGLCKASISYETQKAAAHAVDRLNNFEYPSGEIITVKPVNPLSKAASDLTDIVNDFKNVVNSGSPNFMILASAIATASNLIKSAASSATSDKEFCNVPLPPPQNLADSNAAMEKRCFIVCKPQPPHVSVLTDVFSRFGDLISVSTFPNKTFGFAKYASVESAMKAIQTLDGATVAGAKIKVMEATDDKISKGNEHNMELEESNLNDNDKNKRLKLEENWDRL